MRLTSSFSQIAKQRGNQMSDLSGLHGVFAPSLRWNAEEGFLSVSVFNPETGEREPKEINLGPPATFVMGMATRERGYGAIRVGFYDMKLTPVGSPEPAWPGDEEYKPALGCSLYHPEYGELRLETNAKMFREAVDSIWDAAKSDQPGAAADQQPVIRFIGRVLVPSKALKKSFYRPVIEIIGWVERDRVPGWAARTPTVLLPSAPLILPAQSAPASASPAVKKPAKAKKANAKPAPDDPPADLK
jgi:hypothetical protein